MSGSGAGLGARRVGAFLLPLVLAGCAGRQSALNAAGEDAAAIAQLWWVLLIGAVVLWLAMNGAFFYLSRIAKGRFPEAWTRPLLIGGGIVFPTALLAGLLVWGLGLLPDQRQPGDGLRVRVTGEQWWWRVEYWPEGADQPIVSANEIRLPAGERTEFLLDSDRVIHSFWIPALGGKMDMFPGRETFLSLRPEKPGTYRGQCAEFCGASHAWMAFEAVVMPPEAFDDWLRAEARPAVPAESAAARRGAALFRSEGCGACHTVRGTAAVGQVGPDLTHVGSRLSLGAGRLGATLDDYRMWVEHTGALKPEVRMPAYSHLSDAQLDDLARYLKGLK
ncbi:cytochrome c oxidase subunit II [Pseudooceanicola aestuarii]|uniref:cytochrome c oxidase subunit II n=1 Tax=Pseudooceanicola aestuarii TaxID=2697319 RepID=UPI001EF7BDB0|nr:cytochrome c oxidase subunit II [Pseudooceanicola aestuarii]